MAKRKTYKALGSYIFAGGFALGVKWTERFDIMAHFEGSNYGVPTFQLNFPDVPVYFPAEQWPIDAYRSHKIDWVYTNPPCAPWSPSAGKKRGRWLTDPRRFCVVDCFNLLRELKPKVWCWESVPRAVTHGLDLVKMLSYEAMEMGYSVTWLLHDGQYLGTPQRRRRFFMIAHRVEIPWVLKPDFNTPCPTVREVLASVKDKGAAMELTPAAAEKLKFQCKITPPGNGPRVMWEKAVPEEQREYDQAGRCIGRPRRDDYRLHYDEVCPTVIGAPRIHPEEDRYLRMNEYSAFNRFPEDWKWACRMNYAMSEVARGVTPPTAQWLGTNVAAALDNNKRVRNPKTVLLDWFTEQLEPQIIDIQPPDLEFQRIFYDRNNTLKEVPKSNTGQSIPEPKKVAQDDDIRAPKLDKPAKAIETSSSSNYARVKVDGHVDKQTVKYLPKVDLHCRILTKDHHARRDLRSMEKYMNFRDSDIILDIGAHIGCFSRMALQRGVQRVVAVEPHPDNLEMLRLNTSEFKKRCVVLEAATVDDKQLLKQGTVDLYVNRHQNKGLHSLAELRGRDTIPVQVLSTKKIIADHRPTVIKVDIEGSEYLMDWYAKVPKYVRLIFLEYHFRDAKQVPNPLKAAKKIDQLLKKQGFYVAHKPNMKSMWGTMSVYRRKNKE